MEEKGGIAGDRGGEGERDTRVNPKAPVYSR